MRSNAFGEIKMIGLQMHFLAILSKGGLVRNATGRHPKKLAKIMFRQRAIFQTRNDQP